MGAADVVPGVSGGTMAFILGIYTRFIDAIRSFDLVWVVACLRLDWRTATRRPHWHFILPLLAGIMAALLFFTRVVPLPRLLVQYPEQVYGLFFGLVSASVVVIVLELKHFVARDLLPLVAGVGVGLCVVTAVPAQTPEAWWFIALSGALAICAMVVPGISGSFVLLILGKYAYVLDALGHFNLAVIVPFAAGAALGLFSFARLLSWLLHHYQRHSLLAICGVLIASLWVIWPFQERVYVVVHEKSRLLGSSPVLPEWSAVTLSATVLAALGFVAVMVLQRLAARVGAVQA